MDGLTVVLTYKEHYEIHKPGKDTQFKKGQPSWNKGLTKESDERVKQQSEKLIGHSFTEEAIEKMSVKKKGKSPNNLGSGANFLCVETGKIIHNILELREYVNNPNAKTCNLFSGASHNRVRYGYH